MNFISKVKGPGISQTQIRFIFKWLYCKLMHTNIERMMYFRIGELVYHKFQYKKFFHLFFQPMIEIDVHCVIINSVSY